LQVAKPAQGLEPRLVKRRESNFGQNATLRVKQRTPSPPPATIPPIDYSNELTKIEEYQDHRSIGVQANINVDFFSENRNRYKSLFRKTKTNDEIAIAIVVEENNGKITNVTQTDPELEENNVLVKTRIPTQKATRKFKFIPNTNENDFKSASENNILVSQHRDQADQLATTGSVKLETVEGEEQLKIDLILTNDSLNELAIKKIQENEMVSLKDAEKNKSRYKSGTLFAKTETAKNEVVDKASTIGIYAKDDLVLKPASDEKRATIGEFKKINYSSQKNVNARSKQAELKDMQKKIEGIMDMLKEERMKKDIMEEVENTAAENEETKEEAVNPTQNFQKSFNKISTVLGNNIGFAVAGGIFDIHLKRNSSLPCQNVKTYTTAFDYQKELVLPVYTGERPLTRYCESLGKVYITKLPRVKAGEILIEVTLYVDADEKLSITALDVDSKKTLPIRLELNPTYKSRDVESIMDAIKYKKEDTQLVKLIKELKTMIRDIRVKYDDFEVREEMNYFLNKLTKTEMVDKESVEALIDEFYKKMLELDIKL
jgi:hypothetical protein